MRIALTDRAAMADPYSGSTARSARPVPHTVFRAAGAEVAQIWRILKKVSVIPIDPSCTICTVLVRNGAESTSMLSFLGVSRRRCIPFSGVINQSRNAHDLIGCYAPQ